MKSSRNLALSGALITALAMFSTQAFSGEGDWSTVGGDTGQSKYSPLKQITTQNVSKLAEAWTFAAGGTEITPIVINGIMYYPSGSKIIALDGVTGKALWQSDLNALILSTPELATNPARPAGVGAATFGGRGRGGAEPTDNRFLRLGTSSKYGVSYWPGDGTADVNTCSDTAGAPGCMLEPRTVLKLTRPDSQRVECVKVPWGRVNGATLPGT